MVYIDLFSTCATCGKLYGHHYNDNCSAFSTDKKFKLLEKEINGKDSYMNIYQVLITKEDKKGNVKIIKDIFTVIASDVETAKVKALMSSGIGLNNIDELIIYVKKFN